MSVQEDAMTCERLRLCVILLILLMPCRFGAAQASNARLEGVIRDPSGAVVTGAEVSVVNTHIGRVPLQLAAPSLRLRKLTTEINFHEVAFDEDSATLWLLQTVQITVDGHGSTLRNHHRYSDFMRFHV